MGTNHRLGPKVFSPFLFSGGTSSMTPCQLQSIYALGSAPTTIQEAGRFRATVSAEEKCSSTKGPKMSYYLVTLILYITPYHIIPA